MNISKIKNIFHLFVTLAVVGVLITSCEKDVAKDKQSNLSSYELNTNQGVNKTMDDLYNHLSTQPDLTQMGISGQFQILDEFSTLNGIEFDLQAAIDAYEKGIDQTDLSKEDIFVQSQYSIILDKVTEFGLTPELTSAMEAYRNELIMNGANSKIDASYYKIVIEFSRTIEYMATSDAYKNYLEKTPEGSTLLQSDLGIQARGWWDCVLANIALSAAIAACASSGGWACAGLPAAITNVARACGSDDDGPTDPCENSPNPCCGIHCSGNYVQAANCDCVPDQNSCLVQGCPPGYECSSLGCIPQ